MRSLITKRVSPSRGPIRFSLAGAPEVGVNLITETMRELREAGAELIKGVKETAAQEQVPIEAEMLEASLGTKSAQMAVDYAAGASFRDPCSVVNLGQSCCASERRCFACWAACRARCGHSVLRHD